MNEPYRRSGIKDVIVETDLYGSGTSFSLSEIRTVLSEDHTASHVRNAISTLITHGKLVDNNDGTFKKPTIHWIHSRRLA